MTALFPAAAVCYDVLCEILHHLDPTDVDYISGDHNIHISRHPHRKTLLSLSLCCRAFSDPSLDKLWHSPDGIHPFLNLLPNYQRHNSTYRLMGEISPETWSRVKIYAARVRRLGVGIGINSVDWQAIFDRCQGAPLFPNLAVLSVSTWNVSQDILPTIRALVSPTLREAFISVASGQSTPRTPFAVIDAATLAGTMLQEFAIKSPGLTHLCFYPAITVNREHLMCLSQFAHLEHLYFNDNSELGEDHLLMLAQLEHLSVLRASVLLRDTVRLRLTDGFPNLTELDLRCRPTHLARIVTLMSPMPRLNNLYLNLSDYAPDGFETSLASICRHLGPHKLTHFKAELGRFIQPPRFLMDLLEPLLELGNLEQLQFCVDKHLPLRDEDLTRFAHAWPSLRTFVLSQSGMLRWDPDRVPGSVDRPTLHGLVELTRGCPQLDRLCLPDLDASVLPPDDSIPFTESAPLLLRIENLVGIKGSRRQVAVAAFLDRHFPRLELDGYGIGRIDAGSGIPSPDLEDLRSVSMLLREKKMERTGHCSGDAW